MDNTFPQRSSTGFRTVFKEPISKEDFSELDMQSITHSRSKPSAPHSITAWRATGKYILISTTDSNLNLLGSTATLLLLSAIKSQNNKTHQPQVVPRKVQVVADLGPIIRLETQNILPTGSLEHFPKNLLFVSNLLLQVPCIQQGAQPSSLPRHQKVDSFQNIYHSCTHVLGSMATLSGRANPKEVVPRLLQSLNAHCLLGKRQESIAARLHLVLQSDPQA